ncbi:MAG: bifunctional riboflavin kinase/FAD synthetase [Sedimentisphaerales bacterium]|jgi:riboflavin kinase/FMN adenylyltransferase
MQILRTASELGKLPPGCVLTIGNFDGVHLGHQQILQTAYIRARQENTPLVAMTFDPHPVAILHPEKAPGVLTPLQFKAHLIQRYGVDYLIVLRDSASLLRLTPDEFVDKFLLKDVKPIALIEGDDFHFGSGRSGTVDTLKEMAKTYGFEVIVILPIPALLSTGQSIRVSSTTIRYMLQAGHVADAAVLLGRPYRLIGQVVSGRGQGRRIGYPTLNMQNPSQIIPQEGVYAGYVRLGQTEDDVSALNGRMDAVFSVGRVRTFGEEYPLFIEAHLVDPKTSNLSGKWMAMDFVERIRPQEKFKSVKLLAEQIARDCVTAKNILAVNNTKGTI